MPVNNMHSACKGMVDIWQKCRDVYAGQEAMHGARRETYLPKFHKEEALDYNARVRRSEFFNAFFRTVQGLVGMMFLTPPKAEVSPGTEDMLADVTQAGQSLADIAKEIATESLEVGRVGLLVDYPRATDGEMTVAQAQALGMRPKMALYKAESILNWETRWQGGRCVLSQIVLFEVCCERDGADRFVVCEHEQCRVLELDDNGEVFVEIHRKDDKGNWAIHEPPFYPLMQGKRLREIPFVFISSDSTRPEVELPPLIDLVNMNISHYQSTSDVEHGAHKTAMPQPWIAGIDNAPSSTGQPAPTFYIGGGNAWVFPDPNTQVGMLEYSGQGLQAIETRISKKEEQMAVLGARMLEAQKKGVETAEVAGMHRSGEQSALTTQAETIDSGMTRALSWFDLWAGGSGEVTFALNKDFMPAKLTPEQLRELVGSWQSGALSDQELYEQLQAGGIIDPDKPFEEHEEQVRNSAPKVAPIAPDAGATAA